MWFWLWRESSSLDLKVAFSLFLLNKAKVLGYYGAGAKVITGKWVGWGWGWIFGG